MSLFSGKKPLPRIELTLPKGWNDLSTPQLEGMCRILIDFAKRYTASADYSEGAMLSRMFFLLTGLRITSEVHREEGIDADDRENDWYECEFEDEALRRRYQMVDGEVVPIRIYTWEIVQYGVMQLKWVLAPCNLVNFPYPTLSLRYRRQLVASEGPSTYMQNFSLRQYRFCCDYMALIAKLENSLTVMNRTPLKYGSTRIASVQDALDNARAGFLASLFNRSVVHVNDETGQVEDSFFFVSSQCNDNASFFKHFPDYKFQAISLWWQGMMLYLSRQYPKVFRKEKVGKANDDDPLKLYTRSTTTMIKYAASNEDEVNRTTYTIILQHINDMAEENERIEQMKKNSK